MYHTILKFILILFIIFLTNCGRKSRNIFVFSKVQKVKIKKLAFPSVKGINVTAKKHGNLVSWRAVGKNNFSEKFIGYDIYRLTSLHVIPKKPLNKNPITKTQFFDITRHKTKKQNQYLVRAVFRNKNKQIHGPASQIFSISPEII
jgi:hypothetical protein